MSRFTYQAVLDGGQRISGTLRGRDRADAVRKMREMGYHPVRVELADDDRSVRLSRDMWRRVTVNDLAVFTRQLASLLKAGLPMVRTLATLRSQCPNTKLKTVLVDIEEAIARDGGSVADAMDNHPKVFDAVYRGLVHAGEEGGNLVEVMFNLARHLAQAAKLRGQVIGAFIYPAFLLILGTAAVFVLVTFVIPRFEILFESFGQELPLPTRVLIAVSGFMAGWWWAVLAGAAGLALTILSSLRKASVRLAVDEQLLRLPLFGSMILKLELARIARTLGALLDSGVNILSALRITAATAKNLAIRNTFEPIIAGVSAGDPLAELMDRGGLYPPLVINLVRTGEETGELPEMLTELSAIYEDEAERAVTGAVKLLEPMLIVVMGAVIAGIVAAVILPVFSANAMVG